MADAHSKRKIQPLTNEELSRTHQAEHRPNHDQKWAALKASDAPLVREALLRADEIRTTDLDPAEAYLQGIADLNYFRERQELLASANQTLAG